MTAPALASYQGTLYAAFVRHNDQAVMSTSLVNGAWTEPVHLNSWVSLLPLALAVADNKLYCAVVHTIDDTTHWSAFDGSTWTPVRQVPQAVQTLRAPALGVLANNNLLLSVTEPEPSHLTYDWTKGASGWSNRIEFPFQWKSPSPVGMCRIGGSLHKAIRQMDNTVSIVREDPTTPTGFPWSRKSAPAWETTCGPTLAEHVGWLTATTPWIFLRDADGALRASYYKPLTLDWSLLHYVGSGGAANPIKPFDEVSAARHEGKLYVMYRRR
ncbi:hypothetical protein [Streptomyces alboniger]|uniref:Exo-alpha-sialidase n=1 Tax=Streptomyces alboniger TaxID=132473 RepID=A0A5J6HT00_STRAD|nr:hypothetical protein [Streptomyces alboniger]QEV21994.1 hypothetical protein CP975_34850 [Streptomyces alboniger]